MKDSLGREINYLRIAVTDRCNFRCQYCVPHDGITLLPRDEILSYEEILEVVNASLKIGINRFRITGGEPLLRTNLVDFIKNLIELPGVEAVSLTTNGYLLEQYADELMRLKLSSINISLNSLKTERFKEITGVDGFTQVWRGLIKLISRPITLKINTVMLKGLNEDELVDFARLTLAYPIILRYIEYMPCGKWDEQSESIIPVDMVMNEINRQLGRLNPYQGKEPGYGPARYYYLPASKGIIGFIAPVTRSFCQHCNRLRLTPEGYLKSCLLSEEVIDLKPVLREMVPGNGDLKVSATLPINVEEGFSLSSILREVVPRKRPQQLEDLLRKAILSKPAYHNAVRNNVMSRIGG